MGKREDNRQERHEEKLDRKEKREEKEMRESSSQEQPGPKPTDVKAAPVHSTTTVKPEIGASTTSRPRVDPARADPNRFFVAVENVQKKIGSLENMPALSGPQIKQALQSAGTYLKMALAEGRSLKPQSGRILTPLNNAQNAVNRVAGQSPMLGSINEALEDLCKMAEETFPK